MRCPVPEYANKMIDAIDAVRTRGDSVGGVVTCIARNVPKVRMPKTVDLFFLSQQSWQNWAIFVVCHSIHINNIKYYIKMTYFYDGYYPL